MAALALLVFMAPSMVAWGQTRAEEVTYTLDGNIQGGTNGYATESEITQNGILWMVTGNTMISPWRIGGKNLTNEDRPLYSTSTISDDITKVVVTNGTATLTVNSMTLIVSANSDFSNPTSTISGTWAASSTTTFERPANADWSNKYFKLVYNVTAGTSNQYAQFIKAEFYKEVNSSAPSIDADNIEIAYNITSGEIEYTINNPVNGGVLTAPTTADWLTPGTVGDESVAFTCEENDGASDRSATVQLTYTYNTDQIVTKNVTVTQTGNPNVVDNISDITAAGTYTVRGTIVAKSTRGFVLGDGTGYIYYYKGSAVDQNVGDIVKISGAVSAPTNYKVFQYTSSATITDAETSNYQVEDPIVLTGSQMDDVVTGSNVILSYYVQYEGTLTVSGTYYNITSIDGASTAKGSISYPTSTDFTSLNGKTVTVTGYYVGVSSNQYYNTMLGSIEEVVGSVAAPTFNPAGGTYNEAQTVTISCETPNVSIYYTTDGTDPDDESTLYEGPITVSQTTTIKAIAYDNNDNASAIASATYNIVTPLTIAEVRALADGTTVLTSGVVTHMSGTTAYIEDATGAIVVYGSDVPQQGYNITVSGVLTTYKGLREIGSPTVTLGETGTVTPTVMTIEAINADYAGNNAYQARLVRIEEATYNNGTVSQGENSITVYGTMTGVNDGDVVTFTANIGCHDGVQLVNPTDITITPATVDPTITANNVNIAYDATEGVIEYTINNGVEGGELTATTSADWIELGEVGETIPFTCSVNDGPERTASVMLTYTYNRETVSTEVTVTQAAYAVDYAELPFEWAGGASADFLALNGVTANGLGSDYGSTNAPYLIKFDGTGDYIQVKCDQQPGKVTIGVKMIGGASTSTITVQGSADGETFTDIQTLTISGAQNDILTLETANAFAETDRYVRLYFTKGSNVGVGPITIAVVDYTPSVTIVDAIIDVPAEGGNGTIEVAYANIEPEDIDPEAVFFEADGETPATYTYDWITITFNEDNNAVYTVAANTGEARTAYFKVSEQSEGIYSNLVTVNQAAYVAPAEPGTWVLTDLADLTEDDVFVIVGDNGDTYAMSNDQGTQYPPAAVAVTVVDGTLSGEPADNLKWNICVTDEGYTFYPNGTTDTWLYCTNTNNGVRVGDNTNNVFTMGNDGYLQHTSTSRYVGIYNSQDWRCYTNTTGNIAGQTFAFYKKVELESYELPIAGYGNSAGGYYLIASPVAVDPEDVEGMTTGNYDLYYFDQAEEDEWRNYKTESFNLVPGKGYLYAHKTDVTLTLTGTPYSGDGVIELDYTEGGDFPGWNLVGNPFSEEAYIDHDYYVMNEDGDNFIEQSAEDPIAPMQGIFVIADEDGENLTFTNASAVTGKKVVMNVTNNRSNVIDRAMIRFGEGRQLPKFQLNPNNTKLYIPQYESNYAVVRSENDAEMPVSFKAATNGTYTISISAENVDMEYMVLVDNLTGNETNLLETPSYTFEATATDNANRFTLVYGVLTGVNEQSEGNFAFFNGNSWTISNNGNAILQVVDVTGRTISSETIEGSANVSLNQTPGVYMLRLVNGDNVKVQKVVVR